MPPLLRFLLTCLLLAALPLKGMAAVGVMACGFGHHHLAGAGATEPAVHEHLAHQQPGESNVAADASAPLADAGSAGHASPSDGGTQKCSHCTPCCSSAAPAASNGVRFAPPERAVEAPGPAAHFYSAHVAGLDRPPRLLAA